jgi:hypothetical protein
MPDIRDRIRHAYRPTDLDPATIERGWDAVESAIRRDVTSRRRRSSARAPRVIFAIALLVVSVSSIAIANPDAVQRFITSDDRSKAADRMRVYREAAPVGPAQDESMFVDPDTRLIPVSPTDTVDPKELRLVLTYRTPEIELDVRSAPSTGGQACLVESLRVRRNGKMQPHSGGMSCSYAMRFNGHVTVGTSSDIRMGTIVRGLADDEVRRVRIKLSDGRVLAARLGRNAFALHLPDPGVRTRGLLVDLADGTTLDVAMSGCLRSQLVPPPKSRLGCGFGMNRGPS